MWNIHFFVVQVLTVATFLRVTSFPHLAARAAECYRCSDNISGSSQEPNTTHREHYDSSTPIAGTMTLTSLILEFSNLFGKLNSFAEAIRKSGFTMWSKWSRCSNKKHVQLRFRSCLFGRIGGPYCSGQDYDTRSCCPRGYQDLQTLGFRSCIKYHHHSTDHTDAQERCAKSNGHLIEITSPEKKDVIKNYVEQVPNLITYQYFHVDGELMNGTWVNRNGEPLDYLPWGDDPYLKPGWIYLGLHPEDFLIYDIQSFYQRQYVCEIDI